MQNTFFHKKNFLIKFYELYNNTYEIYYNFLISHKFFDLNIIPDKEYFIWNERFFLCWNVTKNLILLILEEYKNNKLKLKNSDIEYLLKFYIEKMLQNLFVNETFTDPDVNLLKKLKIIIFGLNNFKNDVYAEKSIKCLYLFLRTFIEAVFLILSQDKLN